MRELLARFTGPDAGVIFDQLRAVLDGDFNQEEDSDAASSYHSEEDVGSDYSDHSDYDTSDEEHDDKSSDDDDLEELNENAGAAGGFIGVHHLHPAVGFNSIHCPPLDHLPMERDAAGTLYLCDCPAFGVYPCIVQNWNTDGDPIEFQTILEEAVTSVDSDNRRPNNINRKLLYRKLFARLAFNDYGQGRVQLPNCAVARVRQIYPSIDGNYMGFLEA